MAHIHLKAYFELALHDEDDHDETDGAHHDPQEQFGRGETTHTVAAMIRIIWRRWRRTEPFINQEKEIH